MYDYRGRWLGGSWFRSCGWLSWYQLVMFVHVYEICNTFTPCFIHHCAIGRFISYQWIIFQQFNQRRSSENLWALNLISIFSYVRSIATSRFLASPAGVKKRHTSSISGEKRNNVAQLYLAVSIMGWDCLSALLLHLLPFCWTLSRYCFSTICATLGIVNCLMAYKTGQAHWERRE